MALYKNIIVDNPVPLPSGIQFRESSENHAQILLDSLFDSHKSFAEIIDKHLTTIQSYLSGGDRPFVDFCKEVRTYDNSLVCGLVWTDSTISFRCRTCASNPCMSLCSDCYHNGNHDGHDTNMFRSIGGGICDCGDASVMRSSGFCKRHGFNRIPNEQSPRELVRCAEMILPRLMLRFVQFLRDNAPIELDTQPIFHEFSSITPFFDLLDDVCNAGSTLRSILTRCLLDSEFYTRLNTQPSSTDNVRITHDVYLRHINATPGLLIPLSLRTVNQSAYWNVTEAVCLLDEFLFWLIKYQIPERFSKFLLMLLSDSDFKRPFTRSFINLYGMAVRQFTHHRRSRDDIRSSRLVHISVQLFSSSQITQQAMEEFHLMEMMLASLYSMFSNSLTVCQLQDSKLNYHLVLTDTTNSSHKKQFWPIVADFINILTHDYASQQFLCQKHFFATWINMLSWFQGMNVNHCQIDSPLSLTITNPNYLFAFTAELECCATTLWTIIAHIMQSNLLEATSNAINRLFRTVREWLLAIGIRKYTDMIKTQVTFHLPLHRYIAILTFVALNYQNGELIHLFPVDDESFLLNLAAFPLRIQAVRYEVNSNMMWLSDAYEMQIQLAMYSSIRTSVNSFMNDADLFLLQIVASSININTFMRMFFDNFYVSEWFVQMKKSNYEILLEGSLIVLATIVAFSPHLALNDFERCRAEIINTLAVQDCPYSYLDENIAEPKGLASSRHQIQSILDDVAEYVSPSIEITSGPKQGQYRPKDLLWEDEFDPLHVLVRINRRELFETTMQRYANWAKSTKKFSSERSLWPPYRLHKPKDQFQTNIRCILQSRYFHGVLFSICHWMLNETSIHEDILSLLVYLCELSIDDHLRRSKYGQFLNGYAPSATEPPQCHNKNSDVDDAFSVETLTSIGNQEQSDVADRQIELPGLEPIPFGLNVYGDDGDICSTDGNALDMPRIPCCNSCQQKTECVVSVEQSLTKFDQCYAGRAVDFSQISEHEQQVQKRWDELITAAVLSKSNQISDQTAQIPSYDLEKQFIEHVQLDPILLHPCQNNHEENEDVTHFQRQHLTKENKRELKGIIDGKYETFFEQDDLLVNAHTKIEKIYFERTILDADNEATKCVPDEKSNTNNPCTYSLRANNSSISFSPIHLNTTSVQTNSKQMVEFKSINMSFIQILVHLLDKVASNSRNRSTRKSVDEFLETARMNKQWQPIGDGTVHIARLLVKLERLCSECKTQLNETVIELDRTRTNDQTDQLNKKNKAKAMQQKMFEQIAKKQQEILFISTSEQQQTIIHHEIECCICQSKENNNLLGLVVKLFDTGVLGVREMDITSNTYWPQVTETLPDLISSNEPLFCCSLHSKSDEDRQTLSSEEEEIATIDVKCKHKSNLTCAQFYETKTRNMLDVFSEESVSQSTTIGWRTGIIVNTCGHSIHFSCYRQYLKSHSKRLNPEIDPHVEFKCPMCRQTSNALIYTPSQNEREQIFNLSKTEIEQIDNPITIVTRLIDANAKSCISLPVAEWLTNFTQKIYSILNKNYRTIDQHEKEPNDDIIALFLVSMIRFNLENDLLIRDTEHLITTAINRKSCFREYFYMCHLKYSHLSRNSHASLWRRITGIDTKQEIPIDNTDIPLLLSDPCALLLRIMLSLSQPIVRESYRIIVQALFNLVYIQALFTIVGQMDGSEQRMWRTHSANFPETTMLKYLRIVLFKLNENNFTTSTGNTMVWSLESIRAAVRERCGNFVKIAGLLQHHLYQPIAWWLPGRPLEFDFLWRSLIKELQLFDAGEPYWFCIDPLLFIVNWLDDVISADKRQSSLVRQIARPTPRFHAPRFVELPARFSDLFRACSGLRCGHCRTPMIEPILCLICGIVYPKERSEQKCCEKRTRFVKEHIVSCSGGLNLSLNINSSKTLIQRQSRYAHWTSLYLDQHGEEDPNLRRGRTLYLNANRLKLLYSAWISSNLDQLISRWSTDQFHFP